MNRGSQIDDKNYTNTTDKNMIAKPTDTQKENNAYDVNRKRRTTDKHKSSSQFPRHPWSFGLRSPKPTGNTLPK